MSPAAALMFLSGLLVGCDDDGGGFSAAPAVVLVSHQDGETFPEGSELVLTASVTDPDDPVSSLRVTWQVGGATVCGPVAPGGAGRSACTITLGGEDAVVLVEVVDPSGASGTDQVTLVVIPTGSPTVQVVSPTEAGTYYADHLVLFQGLVDDDEQPPEDLVLGWESSEQGPLDLSLEVDSDGTVTGSGRLSEGEHAITLWAEDTDGKRGSDTVVVEVGSDNALPTCEITSPEDDAVGQEGELVVFEALVGDADIRADQLTVDWSSDRDGPLGSSTPDTSGETVFALSDLSTTTHVVTVTVTDEVGGTCTDFVVYVVGSPPSLTVTSPSSGDLVDEGDSIDFSAQMSDLQDSFADLVATWESDRDGVFSTEGPDSTGLAAFTSDALSAGDHVLTVRVTDTDGHQAQEDVSFTVNGAPGAPTVSITPDPADTEDDLTVIIDADSLDAEGDTVTYTYAWSEDGVPLPDTGVVLHSASTTRGKTYTVVVTPSDGRLAGASAEASVTITNAAPTATTVTVSPDPAIVSDVLLCAYSFEDPDGDADASSLLWTVDGTNAGTDSELSDAFSSGQTVTCTVTPDDGADAGTAVSASITISNAAPWVSEVVITPEPAEASDTLTCSWSFHDEDGDGDASTVAWTVNGSAVGTGTTLAGAFAGGDVVTCTVTPEDGTEVGTPESASLTIDNAAPSVSALVITPDPAVADDLLTCSWTFYDPDGGADHSTVEWTVGSSVVGTGTTLAGGFRGGDTVLCTVTPSDGIDTGTPRYVGLTIDNSAPSVSGVAITPDPGSTRDTLTCSWSFDDPDGDSDQSSVVWTVGGSAVGTDTTLSGAFVRADTVTCEVTPHDGQATGAPDTATLIVGNALPAITAVSISPSHAGTDDTLTVSVATSDADGDGVTVSYAWLINGSGVGATGTSLDGVTWFQEGDEVTVTVTPNDGFGDGPAETAAPITIGNSPPTITDVQISPDPAAVLDTLTCSWTFTDGDGGDTDHSTVVWSIAGATVGSATTLEGVFGRDDEVTCTVTPGDGTDTGEAVSDTLTISNSPPTVDKVLFSPTDAGTDDVITAVVSTTDVDGDTVSLTYVWSIDGSTLAETGSSLDGSSYFEKGDQIDLVVTPDDGTEPGAPSSATSNAIVNTPPTAPEISIDPGESAGGEDLVCRIDGISSDADGDPVTYTVVWLQDEWIYSGTTTTDYAGDTVPGTAVSTGEVWTCVITPNDGEEDGESSTDKLTIGATNSEPVVDSIGLSPSDPATDDTVTATVSTSDDDGDTVTLSYDWTVNGSSVAETGGSLDGATWFDKGDELEVTVTPNDGVDDGDPVTSSVVTVVNTPPTAPVVAIDPAAPAAGTDDLLCEVTTDATDADGDTVSYAVSWDVDGTPHGSATTTTHSGDTVSGGETSAGEVWTCEVTPSDEEEDGIADTASVTIAAGACPVYADPTVLPGGAGTEADPHPSIAYAIAYRDTCTEIVLLPGTYDEQVDFGGVDLQISSSDGAETTIIQSSLGGTVVTFESGETSDASLSGVTISGGSSSGIVVSGASPTITNCIVEGNSGTDGGGIALSGSDALISSVWFENNSASRGGALWIDGGAPTVESCWLEGNEATSSGEAGGLGLTGSSATVLNNILVDNTQVGVALEDSDASFVVNNTIVRSGTYGLLTTGTPTTTLINNIVYDSGTAELGALDSGVSSTLTFEHNDLYGSGTLYAGLSDLTGSSGNISQDPVFTDESADDFSLVWGSNCIDYGQDVSAYTTSDHYGDTRPQGLGTDLGAIESY